MKTKTKFIVSVLLLILSENSLAKSYGQKVDLIPALKNKLDYTSKSQQVVNHNIARANIPKARAKKLEDFNIRKHVQYANNKFDLRRTNSRHIGIKRIVNYKVGEDRNAKEITPVGNNIVLNDQLKYASDNNMDYNETSKVLRSAYSMLKMAGGSK